MHGGQVSLCARSFCRAFRSSLEFGSRGIPAKRRYTFQDAQRWAVYLGLEFKSPPAHPFNPLKPLRVTSAVDDDDLREALAVSLLDAAWSEGRDITSDSVVYEIANSMRLNGKDLFGQGRQR